MSRELNELLGLVEHSLQVDGTLVKVSNAAKLQPRVGKLVEKSALGSGNTAGWSRYLIRCAALEMGIIPSSIHDLYLARGRGAVPTTFTVPAINLRTLSFEAARAVLRAALKINAAALIFEIARSEIGYTAQRPAEYATNVLAAAIAEGYQGPIFIQGDHFQVSAKRYASESDKEVQAVRDLSREAIDAGFFNIDVDTSTLVDISKASIPQQQKLNYELSAILSAFIREREPAGLTISIGGEIGEVGGHNSTEPELRAYMDGYLREMNKLAPGKPGLSKISIQTGTSHGGTVLADGSIAKVDLDFETLRNLSRIASRDYGLGGTVQHGASTLPEENFNQFVKYEAVEVHLATNFMTMFYDNIPAKLRKEIYAWLDANFAAERKDGMSDEQFYYKMRKNAIGTFKAQSYGLPEEVKAGLSAAWESQFTKLFDLLGLKDTRVYVDQFITPVKVKPKLADYVQEGASGEVVSDLAD
jgi:fructose-bisphosphate aldolase class II